MWDPKSLASPPSNTQSSRVWEAEGPWPREESLPSRSQSSPWRAVLPPEQHRMLSDRSWRASDLGQRAAVQAGGLLHRSHCHHGTGEGGMAEREEVSLGRGWSPAQIWGRSSLFLLRPVQGQSFLTWPCRPLLGVQPSGHFLIGRAAAGQASAHF